MRPMFHLMIDGKDFPKAWQDRVLSISATDLDGFKSDQLSIVLDGRGGYKFTPPVGRNIDLCLGYQGASEGLWPVGTFQLDAYEASAPPETITLIARGAQFAIDGNRTSKTRTWGDVTLADVAQTIAKEHGIDRKNTWVAPKFDKAAFENLQQDNETDWAFLTRLAEAADGTFKPANNQLILLAAGAGKNSTDMLKPEVVLRASDLSSWTFRQDEFTKFTAVCARWHDLAAAETKAVQVGDPTVGDVLELRHGYGSEAAAKRAATAVYKSKERQVGTLRLRLPGNPRIHATTPIRIEGAHRQIDKTPWVAKKVAHTYKADGFTTDVLCEVRT